jgi:hypothetical protein
MSEWKWCKVISITPKSVFGSTEDGWHVIIPKRYMGMEQAQKGDIVEFRAEPFVPHPGQIWIPAPKFRATYPEIIAKAVVRAAKPGTRPRPDATAVEWKQEKENAFDADAFREAHAGN